MRAISIQKIDGENMVLTAKSESEIYSDRWEQV